ncbi:hypothetical protein JTE90_022664 [Oedothorax gibbosus]|uniref:RING-type E3 ubiquitin transferase n=1 Tax=Oedothorax gibbosus TaxID=931172 RepID=A0AAV6TEM7_9ARAC|nr:hypothetical protein JTE90_022664 [Oedothorax gibbosus]
MAETLESKYFCHYCTREFKLTDELVCPGCSSDFLEIISKEFYNVAEKLPCDESSDHETDSDGLLIPELSMERLLSQMLLNVAENLPPVPPPEGPSMFSTDTFEEWTLMNADGRLRNFNWNTAEEIDALAFELLDEINVSGPPPLSKDQMKLLPTVKVEESYIEKELQCTVCMDYLQLNEKVKQLPCHHFYHEKCITPWLEKQSTCPNCRQVIQVETKRLKSRPRARMQLRAGNSRRFSDASSISEFFTTSMNPFRYIN